MIVHQDPKTGYWNVLGSGEVLRTHEPEECEGQRFCDIHNRRPDWERGYPLNWRSDRGLMEFICEHGTGHPTTAQFDYWQFRVQEASMGWETARAEAVHGCCGCCGSDHELYRVAVNADNDPVNHPKHYSSDPSGVECIQITRHRSFNIGNAFKYLWRAGLKGEETHIQDLEKAVFYINDEINRLKEES